MPRWVVETRPAGCPTLETEHLFLRPFRDDDLDDYFAVLDTPEVRRWLHLPAGLTRGDAWQQMAGFMGQWALRGTGQWALQERSSGAFLGRAGLHHPSWHLPTDAGGLCEWLRYNSNHR